MRVPGRVRSFFELCRDADVIPVLAPIIVSSARYTIWPIHLWLHEVCGGIGLPRAYAWGVSAAFFSLCMWLVVLCTRSGTRYRGMNLDALLGGSLLAVAAATAEPSVRAMLSKEGLGAAPWVVFLCASGLVLLRSAQATKSSRAAQES